MRLSERGLLQGIKGLILWPVWDTVACMGQPMLISMGGGGRRGLAGLLRGPCDNPPSVHRWGKTAAVT